MRSVVDRVAAAAYDPLLRGAERAGLASLRRELLHDLEGQVLELGAGTGANLDHLGPRLERLIALEPSPAMAERLRRRAGREPAHDLEVIEATAETLPLPTASLDAVVSTLVLCTVGDAEQALAEARRVLRPGGRLVLIEHVRGTGRTETLQRALAPVWRIVGRGCHLTRATRLLVEQAGFDTSRLRDVQLPLPPPVRPGLVGTAIR